jgi:prepilin-type N-terminal cleavage/methylation domain-containing protein
MTHTSFLNARKGFTLVELLVTIAIIGILLGLLLPNLAAVQQTAKAGAQASILQGFGKAFADFSTLDSQGRLTTSAYDHMRDGDCTVYGWLADIINSKFGNPNKSLDPLNRSKLNEKFTDTLGTSASGTFNDVRWADVNRYSDGVLVTGAADATGTGFFGTDKGSNIYDRGFNTNFATSWHFVRGDNNFTSNDPTNYAGFYANDASDVDPSKCPLDGDGPLSSAILADTTFTSSADKIVRMGAARVGDGNDATINASGVNAAASINEFVNDYGAIRKVVAKVGDFTCESFCDGMDATVLSANPLYSTDSKVHENNDIIPNCRMKTIAHPDGSKAFGGGYGNILFADLSCRRVNDVGGYNGKGDGWLGAYKNTGKINSGKFFMNASSLDECRDEMWLGRMRVALTAGGGSSEP